MTAEIIALPVEADPGARPIEPPAEWESLGRAWRWSKVAETEAGRRLQAVCPGEVQPSTRRDLTVVADNRNRPASKTSNPSKLPTGRRVLRRLPGDAELRARLEMVDGRLAYLTDPDTYRLLGEVRRSTSRKALEWVAANQAVSVGAKAPEGRRSAGPDGPSGPKARSIGSHADPTGDAAVAELADIDAETHAVYLVLYEALGLVLAAANRLSGLHARRGDIERREKDLIDGGINPEDTRAGQGECVVCELWCSGAEGDRLKGGMCERHYKAWSRSGRPERGPWIETVRLELEAARVAEAERFAMRVDERDREIGQAA